MPRLMNKKLRPNTFIKERVNRKEISRCEAQAKQVATFHRRGLLLAARWLQNPIKRWRMKSTTYSARSIFVVFFLLLSGCRDQGSNVTVDTIEADFENVSIGANMMPTFEPGPVRLGCQIDVVLRNNSSETLSDLSIPAAELLLAATGESMGRIMLRTEWSGELSAGTQERVTLLKTDSPLHLARIPCDERVYLRLDLLQPTRVVRTFETSEFRFGCVY